MVTKAIIQSIDRIGNTCIVRMPLFETPSSTANVEARALISITPGLYNNLQKGDIVFVAFEENAIEKPIIIGKLFISTAQESKGKGGMALLDSLEVKTSAALPASTKFIFESNNKGTETDYTNFTSMKATADYVKRIKNGTETYIRLLDNNFINFRDWVINDLAIDDGDLDQDNTLFDSTTTAVAAYKSLPEGEFLLKS